MRFLVALALVAAITFHHVRVADACGCFSPPIGEDDYAVNQTSEQIVFEVEPGWVTAHVLINYAGDPSQFAWIVPVPEVPELGLSSQAAFGFLDRATQPSLSVSVDNRCPVSEWACYYEGTEPRNGCTPGPAASAGGGTPGEFVDSGFGGSDAGVDMPPPVDVLDQKIVGNYTTITFRASEANAAVQWLRDNGFVVNNSTSIYMESYIAENMVFVAAKLVPGAGGNAIKPLKLRYRAAYPSVPLILTAVAAQPHLTVTSFIYSDKPFTVMSHPVVKPSASRLAFVDGRNNYPMLLARTIDEAGGDAFVIEYSGGSKVTQIGNPQCCDSATDICNLDDNKTCECPGSEVDAKDCAAFPDLVEGAALLESLETKYTRLSRITTRISPEEMTFDPTYAPDLVNTAGVRLQLAGRQLSLAGCADAVINQDAFDDVKQREGCAAMYCGPNSECVATAQGPACACAENTVAQQFTDLDAKPSVTCVPRTAVVDLRAGGDVLPDACTAGACGAGTCIDRNGVAVCECSANTAATVGGNNPICAAITRVTNTPGAENYSHPLESLDVCAPPPPSCPDGAKYMRTQSRRLGTDCGNATPPENMQTDGSRETGGGCCESGGTSPLAYLATLVVLGLLVVPRRRRRRR